MTELETPNTTTSPTANTKLKAEVPARDTPASASAPTNAPAQSDPAKPGAPASASSPPAGVPARGAQAQAGRGNEMLARVALLLMVLGVAAGISILAIIRYRTMRNDWAFDLAFFHDLVFNASAGRGFVQSASTHEIDGLLNLSHAFFLLPLLVPFYWLVPRLETLLVLQALALASGAWPIARLARSAGSSPVVATLVAGIYLASFPLWRLGLCDFRPLLFCIPALLWLMAGFATRKLPVILVATLVACLAREEVPLLVAAVAIVMLIRGLGIRREALLSLGLALLYFVLQMWIRPQSGFYIGFDRPAGLLEAFHWAPPEGFSRPQQLRHVLAFFPPGLWTGLLEPGLILASLPLLVYQFFISTYEWWGWQGPYVHHMAPLLAFSAAAGARGWGKLQTFVTRRFQRGALLLGAILVGLLGFQIPRTVQQIRWTMGALDSQPEIAQRQQQVLEVNEVLKQIPPDAKIATDYRVIARLSGRRWLYAYPSNFRPPGEESPSSPRTPGLEDVDWMLVNLEHRFWISILDEAPSWRQVEVGGGYRLYRRVGAF